MRFFYPPQELEAARIKVSAYALKRVANGLHGLPLHPHDRRKMSLAEISRDTGFPINLLRAIKPHLCALFEKYTPPNVIPPERMAAVARLKATYHARPIPKGARSFSLSEIAVTTGVTETLLRTPECQATIEELAQQNSIIAQAVISSATAIKKINAYVDQLRITGTPLPWNPRYQCPRYQEIARKTGLPAKRIVVGGDLHKTLYTAIAGLRREIGESFEDQAHRLEQYVDEAIAARLPVPCGPKGIGYTAIGNDLNIPDHRLRTIPLFSTHIARWRDASRIVQSCQIPAAEPKSTSQENKAREVRP